MHAPKTLQHRRLIDTKQEKLPASGHQISCVKFIDECGNALHGYYKPVNESDYPPLLAKYSVAISVAMRLALGERAAAERLVLDDAGNIKGTVSIKMDNYIPMANWLDRLPNDAEKKEAVCPSTLSLLKHNVTELLVSAWYHGCDDRHPKNLSLAGLIDFDMCWYFITNHIKGPRPIDGVFKKPPLDSLRLKTKDITNFPHINGRAHWPTYAIPATGYVVKRYQAYQAFQDLAKNHQYMSETQTISFQEQLFTALLKELLTFDPDIYKARLKEYLGDRPLDFLTLPKKKTRPLSQTFPDLFNPQTNQEPFIDHATKILTQRYKELYRTVVYYPGCAKNDAGVKVPSFYHFLHCKPSAVAAIIQWAEEHNQKQLAAGKGEALQSQAPPILFNIERMKQRYHQIWRDSHLFIVKNWLTTAQTFVHKTGSQACMNIAPFNIMDNYLDDEQEPINNVISSNPKKTIINSEQLQSDHYPSFVSSLTQLSQDYFNIPIDKLTLEGNWDYCREIAQLLDDCEQHIPSHFLDADLHTQVFDLLQQLRRFHISFHLERHLLMPEQHLSAALKEDEYVYPNYTDKEIITACLQALFNWARIAGQENDRLETCIRDVIKHHYEPYRFNVAALRGRTPEVESYLKARCEDGANLLAKILSRGGVTSSSLNTLLLQKLLPEVLAYYLGELNVNLLTIRYKIERQDFNWSLYAQHAKEFAQREDLFTHIHTKNAPQRFCRLFFSGVERIPPNEFNALVSSALKDYEPHPLNLFTNRKRANAIKAMLNKPHTNQSLLVAIFRDGGVKSSSFNTVLFKTILLALKSELLTNPANKEEAQFFRQIAIRDEKVFLHALMLYAANLSRNQPLSKIRA